VRKSFSGILFTLSYKIKCRKKNFLILRNETEAWTSMALFLSNQKGGGKQKEEKNKERGKHMERKENFCVSGPDLII
jgi:hypothetical protein